MTDQERERVLQYFFRKYDDLGPKSLLEARKLLCQKMIQTTDITEEAFDELINDLIAENNWTESRAMAYFECVSIEDRI